MTSSGPSSRTSATRALGQITEGSPVEVAEAIHSFCSYLEDNPGRRPERFHQLTHGAGFLEILRTRVVVGPAVTRQVGS